MSFRSVSCIILVICVLALQSIVCADDSANDAGVEFFEKQIRPLLVQHCYQCHSARSGKREGDLLLDRREAWIQGGQKGPSVVPGDVDASLLIRAVRYADTQLQMPPGKPLSPDAVKRFEQWVRIGAPGPRGGAIVESANPSDPIAGKNHWAYQPLQAASPVVKGVTWPRSSVDTYVIARQESDGVRPVADASPADLIRRVYFQLIGLPPSTQELQTFTADDRPDALERFVDQLIASPHFGERWGRHWLDLARYADSNGLDENFLFREAWRYRNWVIDAVNRGMPFDRFILEQLAGDLLPFESIEQRDRQRIAAGFVVIGPKVLLGNDQNNQRMEIADELVDTVGRALLGQTLGCARCHDHKFDPVPTADYYSMAGIFSSTNVMEMRYMLGEQRVMERLVGLGANGNDADEAYEKYWREHPKISARKGQAESALQDLKQDKAEAIAMLLEQKSEALADGAKDLSKPLDERVAAQAALVAEMTAFLSNPAKIPPRAMIPADIDVPDDEHIRLAGQFDRLGEQVPRGFLTVLCDGARIEIPASESGRIPLARWLFDRDGGAGQLTARVLANRVWYHLIGRGIVRTVDNFGRTGEPPTHPELLDFLAREFVNSGWSLKSLVRRIVSSRTFALSSSHDSANDASDPDNQLLWKSHRRRLDPESLRDAMLFVSGQLDVTPMESSVSYLGDQATAVGPNTVRRRTDFPCRSIYLPVIRNDLPEVFEAFDFTDPQVSTGARPKTTAPTQSLFMLNNDLVMDAAEATARRILSDASVNSENNTDLQIDLAFQQILNTRPTDDQKKEMRTFMASTEARLKAAGDEKSRLRALSFACHALFASTRF